MFYDEVTVARQGRPSAFTDERASAIIEAKRAGLSDAAAASAADITPRTLYLWLAAGRKGDERYSAFESAFRSAEFEYRVANRQRIAAAYGLTADPVQCPVGMSA